MENLSKKLLFVRHFLACGIISACLCTLSGCGSEESVSPKPVVNGDSNIISKPEDIRIGVRNVDPDDPNINGTEYLEKYSSGVIKMKGNVFGGKREGQWFSFYPDGTPWSQSVYIKGMLNGPTVTFHENGKRNYLGEYTDGKRSGKWTFWDTSGVVKEEIDYSKISR